MADGTPQSSDPTEIPLGDLARVSLPLICEGERFRMLDRLESYMRTRQDDAKQYDWDGRFQGYGGDADISPGWFVPYKHRKPASRYDLARMIVKRVTSMLFGTDRFPALRIEGDEEAEDFLNALATEARLSARMIQARDLGGSTGGVGMSFAFVKGKPRIEVHNAKHVTIMRWADRAECVVGAALLAYMYPRRVFKDGRIQTVDFFHVRYWDEEMEIVWEPMPAEVARSQFWARAPARAATHGFGFCPFYWIQNTPDAYADDGEVDYEGQLDNFDELNRLFSATTKGVRSNVDPTLVMKADPALNDGVVKKGSDNVIWSVNGAEYLELKGQSQQAAEKQITQMRQAVLDASGVVVPDPEKLSGAAQSAAALRLLYAPMTSLCDVRREQYGQQGVIPLMTGMLRAAKMLLAQPPQPVVVEGQTKAMAVPALALPPKVEHTEGGETKVTPRTPGESEVITLNWPPYFPATWKDIQEATTTAAAATGNKPVISRRTATQAIGPMWGIKNVDAELDAISDDADEALAQMQQSMEASGGPIGRLGTTEAGKLGEENPPEPGHPAEE